MKKGPGGMLKAIFWDIDGTLLDTERLHCLHLAKVCEKKGLIIEADKAAGASNHGAWHLFKIYEHFDSYEEWVDLMCQDYDKEINPTFIRQGILEVLSYFQERGLRQLAVSNGTRYIVDINLGNTHLLEFFEHTISFDDVSKAKPDPEPYKKAIQYCGITPNEAIAVEDTSVGLQSAKAAGLLAVAFPTSQTRTMDLSIADFIIDHPQELIEIVESLR